MPHGNARPILQRFWQKVEKTDDCWNWTAYINRDGYGTFAGGRSTLAHRTAYELLVGPIPDGLTIDHLCRNRRCVNPDHLEPVPKATNTLRGISPQAQNARKTHCIHGHPFTPENTYYEKNGRHRHCKTCVLARLRANRSRYNDLRRQRRQELREA